MQSLDREAAASYYRKAARLGDTKSSYGNKSVKDAIYNLENMAMSVSELRENLPEAEPDPTRTTQVSLSSTAHHHGS